MLFKLYQYQSASLILQSDRLSPRPMLCTAPGTPRPVHSPFIRHIFGFPKNYEVYKQPRAERFRISVLLKNWELLPLVGVVAVAGMLVCGATYSGFNDRVDIQLTGRNWNCISRNMDLCNPTVHKHLVFNQEYKPWPEMADVLDKMAEKEAELGHALIHHWEIIPLFFCVVFDIFVVLGFGLYVGFIHKVDVQYSGHNWNCISRNMDLCHPTIHKMRTTNQTYEPWPEMQAVLNKMTAAEIRLQAQVDSCGNVGAPHSKSGGQPHE